MATSSLGNRAKDCCVITDTVVKKILICTFSTEPKTAVLSLMQMLRKWQHLHLGTEPRTEHCDITDTVVKKMTTSAFRNYRDQDVVEHGKCRQKTGKDMKTLPL